MDESLLYYIRIGEHYMKTLLTIILFICLTSNVFAHQFAESWSAQDTILQSAFGAELLIDF